MNRLLNLRVGWENRNESVWVIRKTSAANQKKPKVNLAGKKYNLSYLTYLLNEQNQGTYIFNESGDNLSEVIINSLANILDVRKSLKSQGFELFNEQRNIDRLIFTELKK